MSSNQGNTNPYCGKIHEDCIASSIGTAQVEPNGSVYIADDGILRLGLTVGGRGCAECPVIDDKGLPAGGGPTETYLWLQDSQDAMVFDENDNLDEKRRMTTEMAITVQDAALLSLQKQCPHAKF